MPRSYLRSHLFPEAIWRPKQPQDHTSIHFQYRILLTLVDQNFFRLDLPELNIFLVIVIGLNLLLELVLFTYLSFFMPKTRRENDKKRKIWGSYISYMSPLNKMIVILLYQLVVPNKKAFVQFLPQRLLNATFDHPLFCLIFSPCPTFHLTGNTDLLW